MLFRFYLKYPVWAALIHIVLGVMAHYSPAVSTAYFVSVAIIGVIHIWKKRDAGHLTAYYTLYLAGYEIVYRVGQFYLLWELGKYLNILILIMGLMQSRKAFFRVTPFILYLIFMIPGAAVALLYGSDDPTYLRKLILQNMSGPLCLGIAGWYFFRRVFSWDQIPNILRVAILPSITLVTLLSLGKSISEISFATGSNFEASGGFGPNQVSTMLGWGIALLGFALFERTTLTINRATDIILVVFLAFRGLLTFSRGGMLGGVGALLLAFFIPVLFNREGRKKAGRLAFQLAGISLVIALTAIIVNQLTGNFLYYRYVTGGTPMEMAYAEQRGTASYSLSGREAVALQEWEAFKEFPLFGTGAGRGTIFRIDRYFYSTSSHLEFTRMIGEHGILGVFALLIMIFLPIHHFFKFPGLSTRQWLILMYVISTFTMFHSAIRLAMPSVAFGLAFIIILDKKRLAKDLIHRQPALRARDHAHHH